MMHFTARFQDTKLIYESQAHYSIVYPSNE